MAGKRNNKITDADSIRIHCLSKDTVMCPYRHYRKQYFGFGGSPKCPHRYALKKEVEQMDIDEWHSKYEQDYPDES